MSAKETYDASSIQHLSSIEAIRLRPGMYLPDLGQQGLEHLFIEVLDNAIDEVAGGHADEIVVTRHVDGSLSVADNGRGIPCGKMKDGRNALETMLTESHAGGKFNQDSYKNSAGLNGVGITILTALSSRLQVTSMRDGYVHKLGYSLTSDGGKVVPVAGQWDGAFDSFKPGGSVKRFGKTKSTGTEFRWLPDFDAFTEGVEVSLEFIAGRLKKMSHLVAATLRFVDEVDDTETEFFSPGGLPDELLDVSPTFHPELQNVEWWHVFGSYDYTIRTDPRTQRVANVEVVYGWDLSSTEGPRIFSYTNTVPNPDGGSHVNGLVKALENVVADTVFKSRAFTASRNKGIKVRPEDVLTGFVASVRVRMPDPVFHGQTKFGLKSVEAGHAVREVMEADLTALTTSSLFREQMKKVYAHIVDASRARADYEQAKAAEKVAKKASRIPTMPEKLSDSRYQGEGSELFIVEGESPSGQIKRRKTDYQAVYPLKGRPLNPMKTTWAKVRANAEFADLARIIGGVPGKNFDVDDMRYERVIFTADADPAGATIQATLILWFWMYYRSAIEAGRVFVAVTPIGIAHETKGDVALWSRDELDAYRQNNPGMKISYKKGLGALTLDETKRFIIDGETRKFLRVVVIDPTLAEEMLELWFGKAVEPRRERIFEQSEFYSLVEE